MTKITTGILIGIAVATALGIALIASSIADYGQARETTKQVQIIAERDVTIAQINADRDVAVAAINADAAKKSSWAFAVFYLARALTWAAGIVWVLVGLLWGVRTWNKN